MARQQRKNSSHLSIVDGAQHPVVAELLDQLAAAGAPEELLRALDGVTDPDELMGLLAEATSSPPPEDAITGLLSGFADLLEPGTNPLDAELCGAEFLAMTRRYARDESDLPDMLADLISQAEESGSPEALAMLRVLAVTGPPELRAGANDAADRLVAAGLDDLPWAAGLGTPKVGRAFGYGDVFGEQECIATNFSYGRKRHAVVVLIDYVMGGGVKDVFFTANPNRVRAEYVGACERTGCELVDYEREHAHLILSRALNNPPCPVQPDQVEDVEEYLDLLRQRVDLLGGGSDVARPTKRARDRKAGK